MNVPCIRIKSLVLFVLMCFVVTEHQAQIFSRDDRLHRRAERNLSDASELFKPYIRLGRMDIDSLAVDRERLVIKVFLSPAVTHLPVRYPWLVFLETELMNMLGWRFRNYHLELYARHRLLHEYVPNIFRGEVIPLDDQRVRPTDEKPPLVMRIDRPDITYGLSSNHLALWHSHGYYYNASKDRWQWQRARLFGVVEDMATMDYVVGYITPMLENAGAVVLLPRERDVQTHEVIVDTGRSTGDSELIIEHGNHRWSRVSGGFALRDTLFDREHPFRSGKHLRIPASPDALLRYVPDFPADGHYAVYVSYAEAPGNIDDANYVVKYPGGEASFRVNQQIGQATWVYLGHFYFNEGKNPETGSVLLSAGASSEGYITADAVRFGGGMGNVARRASADLLPDQRSADDRHSSVSKQTQISETPAISWKTSQSPRFVEGARYYLQYSGMPDTLVYSLNEGRNDYNDDFMSRGEWVNYLMGAPLGPERARGSAGLGIPVDLSLAFHTDAGVTDGDSVIGTLAIYSAQRNDGLFPDGVSRLASRDLGDVIQDQLVQDVRALVNPDWTRRALWDRQYSEAWRPNVPALLLELYSHQNLGDIRYGLDPRFQFIAGRAIYKGILRFVAGQEGRQAVVQPLPPQALAIERNDGKNITLSWEAREDVLEPTATPEFFMVYRRKEGEGFDRGTLVHENRIELELPEWQTLYSFKVTAFNSGGESFPSEILSVALVPDQGKTVLVVNGFDRVSGPGVFDTDILAGITWWDDHPIPYRYSVAYTGMQYDFLRSSPWLDDDSPGWGASYADTEKKILPGNTFDYPAIHGTAIRNAGYSFVSASRKAFEDGVVTPKDYWAVNLIMGRQKGIASWLSKDSIEFRVFTGAMMQKLKRYADAGGNIMITGAHIGSDMIQHEDEEAVGFAKQWLGFIWRTNNACNRGAVHPTERTGMAPLPVLAFNTSWHPEIYSVEAPDAIEPYGNNSRTVYRYASNKTSAAVLHEAAHKVFTMGFPFETITCANERDELMKRILYFFDNP